MRMRTAACLIALLGATASVDAGRQAQHPAQGQPARRATRRQQPPADDRRDRPLLEQPAGSGSGTLLKSTRSRVRRSFPGSRWLAAAAAGFRDPRSPGQPGGRVRGDRPARGSRPRSTFRLGEGDGSALPLSATGPTGRRHHGRPARHRRRARVPSCRRLTAAADLVNGNGTDPAIPPEASVDPNGHGTHIAGILVGNGTQSAGAYAGIAPAAGLVSVRVLDANGSGRTSDVLAGLQWVLAATRTSTASASLNLSLGHPVYEPAALDPLVEQVEALWNAGIVVVCSAGNRGRDGVATISSPCNARERDHGRCTQHSRTPRSRPTTRSRAFRAAVPRASTWSPSRTCSRPATASSRCAWPARTSTPTTPSAEWPRPRQPRPATSRCRHQHGGAGRGGCRRAHAGAGPGASTPPV